MANYAYPSRNQASNYAFQQRLPTIPTQGTDNMEWQPSVGYNYWLQYLNVPPQQKDVLRRLYNTQWDTFRGRQAVDPTGAKYGDNNFMHYLSKLNPEYLTNQFSSASQGMTTRQFTQPARWVF